MIIYVIICILKQHNDSKIDFFELQYDLDFCIIEFPTWFQDFTHRAPRQNKDNYSLIFYNGKNILPCCNHHFKGDHFLYDGSPWYPYSPLTDGSWVLFKYLFILMPYISCEKDVKSAWGHNIFELIEKVELCRPSKQSSNIENFFCVYWYLLFIKYYM